MVESSSKAKGVDISKFVIESDGSVRNNIDGQSGRPVWLTKNEVHFSLPGARTVFLKDYSGPGGLEKLKALLLSKRIIDDKDIQEGTWITSGVDSLIRKYTYDTVLSVQTGTTKNGIDFDSWLNSSSSSVPGTPSQAGTKSRKDSAFTTVDDADREIDAFILDAIGRSATMEEKKAFFKAISAREKSSSVVSKTTKDSKGDVVGLVQTGDLVTAQERLDISFSILKNALKGTDIGTILESSKGSKVAVDISNLQSYASSYGISMTSGKAFEYIVAGLGDKDYLNKQKERLRQLAIQMYPTYKDHFTAGGTLEDVTDQYAFAKSKKLGVTVGKSTEDKDVMDAISKGTTLNDFNLQLQGKPEWRLTPEAHQIGANFAENILTTFGMMG